MVGSMKTTFDIPEPLLRDVQKLARDRHTTTKSLVEQALIRLLDEAVNERPYVMPDATVGGKGLTPEFQDAPWEKFRDAIYGDHG
jgi:hypothetical protein